MTRNKIGGSSLCAFLKKIQTVILNEKLNEKCESPEGRDAETRLDVAVTPGLFGPDDFTKRVRALFLEKFKRPPKDVAELKAFKDVVARMEQEESANARPY